jgi:hypothetical protein
MSAPNRRAMVERPGKDLSVRRQCVLLSLTRSGVYPGPFSSPICDGRFGIPAGGNV